MNSHKNAILSFEGRKLLIERIAVMGLMPEWKALNADPRAPSIALGHLLSMTPGFDVDDPSGTAPAQAPAAAWSRTIGAAPRQRFAYDNSVPSIVSAVLERFTGQTIEVLAREQLFKPLAMREPSLQGGKLRMRTEDMAKLGHLLLSNGSWSGQPMMPHGFAAQITGAKSAGGDPVRLPYGLLWWAPSGSTYFASGYGGQLVWVHAPMDLVVAATSVVSRESPRRCHALKLTRGPLFQAVRARLFGAPSQ